MLHRIVLFLNDELTVFDRLAFLQSLPSVELIDNALAAEELAIAYTMLIPAVPVLEVVVHLTSSSIDSNSALHQSILGSGTDVEDKLRRTQERRSRYLDMLEQHLGQPLISSSIERDLDRLQSHTDDD